MHRKRRVTTLCALIGALSVFLASALGLLLLPTLVQRQIAAKLTLRNNSLLVDRWAKPNVPMLFKVWLFDVVNAHELQAPIASPSSSSQQAGNAARVPSSAQPVLNAEQRHHHQAANKVPRVVEVGPFVFSMRRSKDIVARAPSDELLMYTERKVYHFEPSLSCCPLNTSVTVPNIPLAAVVERAMRVNLPIIGRIIPRLVNRAVQTLRETVFVRKQTRELLFDGYEVELLKAVAMVTSLAGSQQQQVHANSNNIQPQRSSQQASPHTFGLFLNKNNTWRPEQDGVWAINTGAREPTKLAKVMSWNGMRALKVWPHGSPQCNAINGTDGSLFAPPIAAGQPLQVFNPEICRSVSLAFVGKTRVKSIDAFRYTLAPSNFAATLSRGHSARQAALRRASQLANVNSQLELLAGADGGGLAPTGSSLPQAVRRSLTQASSSATLQRQLHRNAMTAASASPAHLAVDSNLTVASSPQAFGSSSSSSSSQRLHHQQQLNPHSCFCDRNNFELNGVNVCEFDGLVDLSKCSRTASVVFGSPPHFAGADVRLASQVRGLAPNVSRHTTYMELEPVSIAFVCVAGVDYATN